MRGFVAPLTNMGRFQPDQTTPEHLYVLSPGPVHLVAGMAGIDCD